jgi:type II secretory pathway component PulF
MPTFQYKAKTPGGEVVTGTVAAGDRRLALVQLGRLGYFPLTVDVAAAAGPAAGKPAVRSSLRGRVGTRDVLTFSQQLTSLLRSGMSLSDALGVLERRTQKKAMAAVLGELRNDIVQGASLSDALAKHPKLFSKLYVNLVRAGEASGALDEVLVRLVQHSEQVGEVREKIVSALIYPAIVVIGGFGTIVFFMTVMVPRFAQMFKELGGTMPLPTRILIGLSDAALKFWWIPAGLIVIAVVLYRQQARTPEGQLRIDAWKLRVPIVGQMIKLGAFTLFARTLATLLENGVPVLNALQIVEETMNNRLIAQEIHEARTRVTDGTSISTPLAKGKIFPPLLIDMLAVGEESGEVVPVLKTIADTYQQELSRTLNIFTTILAPVIIIFVALGVGAIALSVLTAVFSITSGLGK